MKMLRARIGWSNPGTAGGDQMRVYSEDAGTSPRWDNSMGEGGRTLERGLLAAECLYEGDRLLVVHLGNRFTDDETVERVEEAVRKALG